MQGVLLLGALGVEVGRVVLYDCSVWLLELLKLSEVSTLEHLLPQHLLLLGHNLLPR